MSAATRTPLALIRPTADQMMINANAANRGLGLNTMELLKSTTILCADCAYSISLVTVLWGVESSWRNDDMERLHDENDGESL